MNPGLGVGGRFHRQARPSRHFVGPCRLRDDAGVERSALEHASAQAQADLGTQAGVNVISCSCEWCGRHRLESAVSFQLQVDRRGAMAPALRLDPREQRDRVEVAAAVSR